MGREGESEKAVAWRAVSELDLEASGFEIANVRPQRSGLPFVVFVSQRGGARHDVRVKVHPNPHPPRARASVSVRPAVQVMDGDLDAHDFAVLRDWIELNRDVILKYWEGEIAYTEDMLAALRALPG